MARTKAGDVAPFVKLLTLLKDGNVVTKADIESKLSKDIVVYRLSTYIWEIKSKTPGVVKVIKDGRAVSGYQITNPAEVEKYLAEVTAKQAAKPVKSLASLNAKPAKAAKPAKVKAPAKVEDEVEVTELTD